MCTSLSLAVCVSPTCYVTYVLSRSFTASQIAVRIGSSRAQSGGQQLFLSKFFRHEKFDIGYSYDVAVLKTAAAMKLDEKAKPVKLAKAVAKTGTKAVITGFGNTSVSVIYLYI